MINKKIQRAIRLLLNQQTMKIKAGPKPIAKPQIETESPKSEDANLNFINRVERLRVQKFRPLGWRWGDDIGEN